MVFRRGDVVLIPFPYTDLSATKTRPAVVVSSVLYHNLRTELLLAYLSSRIAMADPRLDYVLTDWKEAGLLKPTFMRPKIAAIEPDLVIFRTGALTKHDLAEVDERLRQALGL